MAVSEKASQEELSYLSAKMSDLEFLAYTGMGLFFASRLFGVIRPWFYASSWNNTFFSALKGNGNSPMVIAPVLSPDRIGFSILVSL